MRKYFLFFIFIFISCSQSFIEETQDVISMRASVSNDLDTGILLKWDTQWDFARTEMLRGEDARSLSVFKNHLVQSQLLDSETKPGRDYYYQIRAYNSKDRIIGQSSIVKGYRNYRNYDVVEPPTDLFFNKESTYIDKIKLSWVGNDLDVFRVYRSSQSDGTYDLIAEIEELTFVDQNLKPASTYFYKISVVGLSKSDTGETIKEKFAKYPIEGKTKYAPTGLKASTNSEVFLGGIELTWDADYSAQYYELYRANEEDGEYKVIVPVVVNEQYIDNNLPDKVGTPTADGSFVYPSYFYKVKSITSGVVSDFSDSAEGKAINPDDTLDAPESFELEVDKSSYPYKLTLSWNSVSSSALIYRLSKINGDNTTNLIKQEPSLQEALLTSKDHLPNFNERVEYIVQVLNPNAGNRPGFAASINYVSAPAPPVLTLVSKNARIYKTNTIRYNNVKPLDKLLDTHVYWYPKNNKSKPLETSMTGSITEEWHITSEVEFINLEWGKTEEYVAEIVEYYSIYRRKKGVGEFKEIHNNITQTKMKDELIVGQYEYYITAWYSGQESISSKTNDGQVMDKTDILPAPSYLTVPYHWANFIGFGQHNPIAAIFPRKVEIIVKETLANKDKDLELIFPKGSEKLKKLKETVNTMYLTWDKVEEASSYEVRHTKGKPIFSNDTGEDTTPWYTNNPKDTKQWFNNDTTTVKMTHLYQLTDFAVYTQNTATFNVVPVNKNGVLGDERGIIFSEPSEKPAYY